MTRRTIKRNRTLFWPLVCIRRHHRWHDRFSWRYPLHGWWIWNFQEEVTWEKFTFDLTDWRYGNGLLCWVWRGAMTLSKLKRKTINLPLLLRFFFYLYQKKNFFDFLHKGQLHILRGNLILAVQKFKRIRVLICEEEWDRFDPLKSNKKASGEGWCETHFFLTFFSSIISKWFDCKNHARKATNKCFSVGLMNSNLEIVSSRDGSFGWALSIRIIFEIERATSGCSTSSCLYSNGNASISIDDEKEKTKEKSFVCVFLVVVGRNIDLKADVYLEEEASDSTSYSNVSPPPRSLFGCLESNRHW